MKNKFREVSEEKMNALLRKGVVLAPCKACGSIDIDLVISLGWFSNVGARCVCRTCGKSTKPHSVHDLISHDGRMASPISKNAIMRGAFDAMSEWGRLKGE